MRVLLLLFLWYIALYHVINTWVVFWSDIVSGFMMAGIKDIARIWVVLLGCITYKGGIMQVIKNKKIQQLVGLLFLCTVVWVVVSLWQWVSPMSMLIGIKYDIYPLYILVSAIILWMISTYHRSDEQIHATIERRWSYAYMCIWWIVIAWLLWQWAKMLFPSWFYTIGYGMIGDYVLWGNPPLWYRTWPWWMMRLQWLFAWPNNYWFFLVALFPIYVVMLRKYASKASRALLLWSLFGLSIAGTLSRWVIVWVIVSALLWWLTATKKIKKRVIWWTIIWVIAVVWLSILKPWSTLWHSDAWNEWMAALYANPRWYGLWTSWPSVHFEWVYLPENQYLGVALDMWVQWLLLWLLLWWSILRYTVQVVWTQKNQHLLAALALWLVWLWVEWLFLHVLEDSMVNYLVLVPFWLLLWVHLRFLDNTCRSNRWSLCISWFSCLNDLPNFPPTGNKERLDNSFDVRND